MTCCKSSIVLGKGHALLQSDHQPILTEICFEAGYKKNKKKSRKWRKFKKHHMVTGKRLNRPALRRNPAVKQKFNVVLSENLHFLTEFIGDSYGGNVRVAVGGGRQRHRAKARSYNVAVHSRRNCRSALARDR